MHNLREKVAWAIAGVLALFVAASATGVVQGGPLDPPGPFGSTMRTIDEVLPSWSKALTSNGACTSQRFSCVLSSQAVLDHETGLVWSRDVIDSTFTQADARDYCRYLSTGGRLGWRLPTIEELNSLIAPDANGAHSCRRGTRSWASVQPTATGQRRV